MGAPPVSVAPLQAPPQLRPPAALPVGAPRPQLVPADAPNPYGSGGSAGQVPATTMSLTKPAGQDSPSAVSARPVVRPSGSGVAGPNAPRPQLIPADQPVVAMQPQPKTPVTPAAEVLVAPITRERAFRLDDDVELNKRLLAEIVESDRRIKEKANEKFDYNPRNYVPPVRVPLVPVGTPYVAKTASYPPAQSLIEPGYVVHRRLLFEEKNSERHGWDLGIVQPLVSTAFFYKDVLLWPAHLASNLHEPYDTSAGKCAPGSPVPYYLYPEEITLFGGIVGSGVFVGSAFIFP